MNITKFGAFVNILPGRDGLLHISKLGGGKRIDRVEDVLDLGDEIEVRVDDVDPNGKVSLSARSTRASTAPASGGGGRRPRRPRRSPRPRRPRRRVPAAAGERRRVVSFEDAFDAEVREEFGDLGPGRAPPAASGGGGGGGGGGGDRGGAGGGGAPLARRRRR